MAVTAADVQRAFQNSLGRAPSQADIDAYVAASNSGALTDLQIYQTISNSQEANLISDPVVRFYQAAFGRVPDADGLDNAQDYVRAFTPSAQTYITLANEFAESQEFTNRFGAGQASDPVTAAYIQSLYSTILGRQASAAEIADYTSNANGYGTRGGALYAISQSQEAISISDNAVNGFLLNAAEGDAVYTGTLYTPENGVPNNPGQAGRTFTLTQNIDAPGTAGPGIDTSGTDNDDTYIGDDNTYGPGDLLDGNGGNDTFQLFTDNNNGPLSIRSVEVENFEVTSNFNGATTLNLAAAQGLETFSSINSSAFVQGFNIQDNVVLALDNSQGGIGAIFANGALGTAPATIQLNSTNSFGQVQLGAAGAETISELSIDLTGVNGLAINDTNIGGGADTQDGNLELTTLTITGAGFGVIGDSQGFNINADAAEFQTVTTVDATGNQGGVFLNLEGSESDVAYDGGSGNDVVLFGDTYDGNDDINGGGGYNALGVDFDQASTVSDDNVSNIDNLILTGTATADVTITTDDISVTDVTIAGDLGGNVLTLDEFDDGTVYLASGLDTDGNFNDSLSEIISGFDFNTPGSIESTINGTVAFTGTDTASFTLGLQSELQDQVDAFLTARNTASASYDVTVDTIDASGVSEINVNTTDDAASSLVVDDLIVDSDTDDLTISGAGDLVVADLTDGGAADTVGTIDLSNFTGAVSFGADVGLGLTGSQVFTLGDLSNPDANSPFTAVYDFATVAAGANGADLANIIDLGDDATASPVATDGDRDVVELGATFDYRLAIENFGDGATANDDVLDFSALDVSAADINFTDGVDGLLITVDGFTGSILVVGSTAAAFDQASLAF